MKFHQDSFSLIEIIVFVSMIIVLFVSVLGIYVRSLHTVTFNENKIIATHYAEELSEWFRFERDVSWVSIATRDGTYCFNSLELDWPLTGACSDFALGEGKKNHIFKREAIVIPHLDESVPNIVVSIHVSWIDGTQIHKVTIPMRIYKTEI